ncbi:MAG: substrate-binding domain-containing protein, partial [Xanthomonadaceae bacterium]|nr:substrate-binding domain-containing protein [Xanthomonadaceae bacterium]
HADFSSSQKADGLILLGYGDYQSHRDKLEKLVAQGTRFVRWGAVLPGQPGVSIGCDNFEGGRLATAHLIEQGCRHIAFLGDATPHYPEFHERYRGYAAALREAGLKVEEGLQADAETTEQAGYEAAELLLERGQKFDAVFGASDLIAIGALRALIERGVAVPGDVAVAGFDDIPVASFIYPSLTTVRQDTGRAGEVLVEQLVRMIDGESVESAMLPAQLKVRRSSLRPEP